MSANLMALLDQLERAHPDETPRRLAGRLMDELAARPDGLELARPALEQFASVWACLPTSIRRTA